MDVVSMVTTTPNEVVRPVHPDRMPMILREADQAAWMEAPPAEAMALIRPRRCSRPSAWPSSAAARG